MRCIAARTLMALVLLTMALPNSRLWASDTEINRATLRGLQGVYVLVERVRPDAARHGLSTAQIQTDIELRLQQADIPVLSEQESVETPGNPFLYVNLNMVQVPALALYAYSISISLEQNAYLERGSSIKAWGATTWLVSRVGVVKAARLCTIRDQVRAQVDQFINAYIAVNHSLPQYDGFRTHQAPAPTRAHIRQAQVRLKAAGFDPGPIDGRLGPRTRNALRWYQNAHALPITGQLDDATSKALGGQ